MKPTEQTIQQLDRFIRKIAAKFPATDDAEQMTDIHIRVSQDTGEMVAFNDDDDEITRCVVEQWIENKDDDFYEDITSILRRQLETLHETIDNLSIFKPYSFVLEDDDKNNIAELRLCDDDTVIIDEPDLMEGLDKDLDEFFKNLFKD
jgi:hypothetical protein